MLNLGHDLLGCDSIVLILVPDFIVFLNRFMEVCESRSVVSDSLHPMDYTVHGIFQAIPFTRLSSQPRDRAQFSRIAGNSLQTELQGKPLLRYD